MGRPDRRGAAAFAAGTALGQAGEPLLVLLAAVVGALAVGLAAVHPRWFLVAILFLLPAYIPDALASPRFAYVLTAVALAATVIHWVTGRERFQVPRELLAFAALALAYGSPRSSRATAAPPRRRRSTWSATAPSSRC